MADDRVETKVRTSPAGSEGAPARAYDTALLDLDGVVYAGGAAVPHAVEALRLAREGGMRLAYVTNNASRTPQTVAAHLTELGVPAEAAEVVTSAQAVARLIAERLPAGSRVLCVGGAGLRVALAERGSNRWRRRTTIRRRWCRGTAVPNCRGGRWRRRRWR